MAITAAAVKELRQTTGLPLMDCKFPGKPTGRDNFKRGVHREKPGWKWLPEGPATKESSNGNWKWKL